MAMEKLFTVRDAHTRPITALGYFPTRREILIGFEDGVIKSWESDTGKLVNTYHDHRGWITDFLYWPDKLMLSAANDGQIVVWGSGGSKVDEVTIGQPVYVMAINPRRHQLLCGVNSGIRIYSLDDERECGHYINPQLVYMAPEHSDIVRCLVCHESRVYSAGYDQKLIVYDSSYTGDESMQAQIQNKHAHDAGISCLLLVKDNENNTWIVTGSFDKTVRIWSTDGKLVHRLDGFLTTVTGLCYVPRNKTIWAAGGYSYASLFDPKSGDNVSDFIGTFQEEEEDKYQLQLLKYFPEQSIVVGSTNRRHLMVWKYNASGCITALKCKSALESLTYTRKVPILVFSGDTDGVITKWERMQSNHYMYSKEFLPLTEAKKMKNRKKEKKQQKSHDASGTSSVNNMKNKVESRYIFNKPMLPPITTYNHPHTTLLTTVFVEDLDLLVAGCEDGNVYVWGFDEDAVKALKTMSKDPDQDLNLASRFSILLSKDSELLQNRVIPEEDSVTNRVAGFICKHILSAHSSFVTSLAVIGREYGYETTYLVSAGWDRRICIWNLETGELHDTFRNPSLTSNLVHVELACDGIITDLAYCPPRNEIAYSSSDKMVYIRRFSPKGIEMVLLSTLQGHYNEVTCVKWNAVMGKWVTGSEDGTIRIWAADGLNECEQVLSTQGAVGSLCMDRINGAIVAGVQDQIRVFEPDQYRLMQTNVGHTDSVRSILHVPERNQYISCSWDKTIRIWNAWKLPKKKRRSSKDKKIEEMMLQRLQSKASTQDSDDEKPADANDKVEVETGVTEQPSGVTDN